MKSKQRSIAVAQATNPLRASGLIDTRVHYLEGVVRAFLAEVEEIRPDGHVEFELGLNLREEVRRLEIDLIKYALQPTGGHQGRAAELLGVKATTLNSKIKLYGLLRKPFRRAAEYESATRNISPCPAPMLASDATAADKRTTSVS